MSKLPNDPFARSNLPAEFDLTKRVELVGHAAQALIAGQLPDPEARLFLAGAILGWLEHGGDLARDYLQVVKPKSHQTASALWRQICARHFDENGPR